MFNFKKGERKAGSPPGTLIEVEKQRTGEEVDCTLIQYNLDESKIKRQFSLDGLNKIDSENKVNWLHINSTFDDEVISRIGEHFNLHRLLMEDIQTDNRRPKIEEFEDILFIAVNVFNKMDEGMEIMLDQLNMVLSDNFLITFQNSEVEFFQPILDRIKSQKSNIRNNGEEYLLYAIKDYIIDRYFTNLEDISEKMEELEQNIIEDPDSQEMQEIYDLKKTLITFRKSVWPLREIANKILRGDFDKIEYKNIEHYYHDLYDHIIQVIEIIESLRDVLAGLLDLYMSSVSNKMNKIMQFLTIIGTIFIPLTFIAGIYGMNFEYMPELEWKFSYPAIWGVMILITLVMLYIFKRRDWL